MFTVLGFTPFFYLIFFGKLVSKSILMSYTLNSAFDDIKYLLFVLLGSEVGIGYCTPYFYFC